MTLLRAVFQFDARGFPIERSALGSRISFSDDRWSVEVQLPAGEPTEEEPFAAKASRTFGEQLPGDDRTHAFTGASVETDGRFVQSAALFRVIVTGEADVSFADLKAERPDQARNRFFTYREEALRVARSTALRVMDWLRSKARLPQLGMTGDSPQLAGEAFLDLEARERLPIGLIEFEARVPSGETAVDDSKVAALAEYLRAGAGEPSLAEQLLADAAHLTQSVVPKPGLSVLLAAVAVELAVKAKLREAGSEEQLPLVELMLDHPRDYSFAAVSLCHEPLKAVCGRSLSDEDNELFRAVERLFKIRNDVAHRASIPNLDEARVLVDAGYSVLDWLASF